MKQFKLFFACALMSLFSLGQVWAGTGSITFDFEDDGAHRASGNNSYAAGPQSYSENSVDISCTYMDVVTTGTPLSGIANALGRVAKNTTNSPVLLIGPIDMTDKTITGITYYTKGVGTQSQVCEYSTNGSSWTTAVASFTMPTSSTQKSSGTISVAGTSTFYLRITTSVESSTGSPRDLQIDDVVISYSYEDGGTPTCANPTFSPVAGSYEGTQNVTITSTTGATIYYTTDDSDPTTSGTRQTYSSSIAVSADMTIKAYAVKDSYNDSEVATAAYTITEGPDVTIDFTSNTEWAFPADYTLDEDDFSDGTYTVTVKGEGTGKGYKYSSGKLLIGQNGAYLILPEFTSPIDRIVCPGVSGASSNVKWNVYDGTTAVSTQVTGCTSDVTFEIDPQEANKQYTIKVESAHNLQIAKIKIYFGAAPAVAKPTISGDENFVGSTTVTITHADADAIYYTTNGVDPTTSSTEYTAPFVVNADGTTTVKAIAVKGSDVSEVASKGFTKVTALESLAALLEATVSAETAFNVVIDNWVVTGVNGTRAWISDAANEKGILLYKSGHNFVAGNKLNGVVIGTKSKLYQGYPELTSLVSTDVTVTTAETVTPRETTLAAIVSGYNAEQGTVVKLTNVTYIAGTGFSDGINTVALNTTLYTPTMVDGATYDIIGVVRYDNGPAYSIMPRKEADVEAKGAVVIPTAANLAALKAAARGTYILTLTNAVVTYVNGNNAFIEDATGGALIYFASHGYSAGDCLNGDYQVVTTDYQGKFEITAMEPQAGAATTTAAIPLTTLTITQLNADFAAYESRRIKIEGVNVTDALTTSDRNGQISDGVNTVALYAGVASTVAVDLNANIDIIGYPGFHNTDEQLTVWANEDITVNVKDPAGIAFTPESETITGDDPWSAPTFANPNGLTVTFNSDNTSVATVSNEGVVALEGGYGTAVITAHTNGDATHNAGNATYTITVNDPGATPVYTMSFDLTRASYDDAADAEVVWNSNVVTITAQKSSGTKVTNYLAGNYSGTTLIEETRLYENNNLVFTPQTGVTITKVEWTATSSGYAESLADYSAWTNATASVDGSKVVITPSATGEFSVVLGKKTSSTKGTRGTSVAVFYTAESEKAKLTASIAIDNMNMAVGDDDILLSAIAATSNPNKKAISYAVTSGTAVTIEGTGAEAALHAAAEGSATITATIPDDLGNYTGATTTFTITVAAAATLESIAIDGTATELEYTEGQSFNPAGLTVMGHYSNGSDIEITSGIDWTFDPDPLTEGTTSVSVTATVESINSPAFVVNGLTVSAAAPAGDDYIKVTALQTDWSGDYILVYEDGTDAYVWNGDYSDGASNYASATISSNTIAKPAAAAVITIAAASEGKYTLQVNGDKYFQDNGSKSKLIFTDAIEDAAKVTISYETDWTKLQFSERCIRFNSSSGQTRFRFYAASGQQAVQLYKKVVPVVTPETVRTGLEINRYYTVCLPKKITSVTGGTFWTLTYKDAEPATMVYIEEATPPFAAGKPYIFQATATSLQVVYEGDATDVAGTNGALVGTLADLDAEALAAKEGTIYLLIQNALRPNDNNYLSANRAYIRYDLLTVGTPVPAPGKRVRTMPLQGQTITGIDELNTSETPAKLMINGQLFILRGEKMYDAQGRLVK